MLRPQSLFSGTQFRIKINELSSASKWKEVFSHYRVAKRTGKIQFTEPALLHPILKSCLYLTPKHGESLHACFIKDGLDLSTSIANSIINYYVKSKNIGLARRVFDHLRDRDSVSWNVIINGYFDHGGFEEGMQLFNQVRSGAESAVSGVPCKSKTVATQYSHKLRTCLEPYLVMTESFVPNNATLVMLFQACRRLGDTDEGLRLHGYMIRSGYMTVISIRNSVLNFYADFEMKSAQNLFDEMCDRDLISWSVMIGAYTQSDEPEFALRLFREILCCNEIKMDAQLAVNLIKVSNCLEDLGVGKMIHGVIVIRGFHDDLFVANTLIDMYSKCHDIEAASRVFMEMFERNIVTYNSLLSGFVGNEKFLEALNLFRLMQRADVRADEVTMVNLLQTSKYFLHSVHCKSVHSMMLRLGHENNELVTNSLVDAYAKCNQITLAWKVFHRIEKKDTVTWSTMVAGFTTCGMPGEAISLFQEMNRYEKSNAVTILNLLEACSGLAEVKRSKSAHAIAIRSGVADDVAVGTAILDMYSKCGAIDTCERVFKSQIPRKNIISWSAMISAYGMNGLPRDALALIEKMKSHGLKPNPVTILAVLSSCSHGGLIKEGLSYFNEVFRDNGGIKLGLEHYSCVVDLLARGGKLDNALDLIKEMPSHGLDPGPSTWGAFLSACRRNYGNGDDFEIGADAVSRILELEPCNSGGYMLALSMYASGGSWVDAARMRGLMRERGVRVAAGYSLVHVNGGAFKFVAGEKQIHSFSGEVCTLSQQLHFSLKMDKPQDQAFLEGL